MSNIEHLRMFRKKDIEWLHTWFEDAEVKRRLEGMTPLDDWFRFADGNENYRVWAALKEGKPVGVVMVEIEEDSTGNIALLVDPLLRGRGYGKALIKRTMESPEMSRINKWFAGIEEDNKGCLACFRSVGYSLEHVQPDEDGYYSLIYVAES